MLQLQSTKKSRSINDPIACPECATDLTRSGDSIYEYWHCPECRWGQRKPKLNDPVLFRSNPPVNASIARWLVAQGWKPAELAPNWWAAIDQNDDYIQEVSSCQTFKNLV
uniref:Uncharacterized protein n=1 Tax=viral metagenome TaxID=1070528 RepID=A0A6H1ZJ00_9ZZZZ